MGRRVQEIEESDEYVGKRMNTKLTKGLISPICPLRRTHWNDEKRARGN